MATLSLLKIKQEFSDFLKTVFPATKFEFFLFLIFLAAYGTLGTFIGLNYRIIFDDRIPWDAYFSFDNRAIVMTGGGYERHPLANYLFDWLRNLAYLFSAGKRDEIFRVVLAWCSNVAVSLSVIQVYKYVKNIIGLPQLFSVAIVLFFALFSTTILLSFTPETYTYTLFFLVLFNYYAALKLRKEEKIPASALVFAGVSVGGLTITNIVKVYIPLLFEKDNFKKWKNFGFVFYRVLLSVVVFVLLFFYRMNFKQFDFFKKSEAQLEKFSATKLTPVWDMIASWFLGGNMLFAGFELRDYHSKKGFLFKALFMDVYQTWLPYVFVAAIGVMLFWTYIKNFKNKFVQILMISFLVDVIIHCVLKFGLHTGYIYGGHFIFVVPLMFGWLFHSYRKSPRILGLLLSSLVILFFYLAFNNIFRMAEFFTFLNQYYR